MALRLVVAAACLALVSFGCDEAAPMNRAPTTARSAATTDTSANASPAAAAKERISLGAIPLTMEVPKGWQLQPGEMSKIVLHGRLTSGEVDVLLSEGLKIKADALGMMEKVSTAATADHRARTEVVKRDGMTIVQTIAPQTPPNTPPSADPELVPMGWTVQCIISDGKQLDYPIYELTFLGLSQAMFDRDEAWLRQMVGTIRYEPATTQPAAR